MTAAALSLGATAFFTGIRPWYLRWGATDAEAAAPMPLDERVPDPTLRSTMAITIAAPPEAVWPWLAQMGDPPRAGYYSYTSLERLVGLRIVNADEILPEFQTLQVGQALDTSGTMVVQAVEPGRSLVLGPTPTVETAEATWAFRLEPVGERSTRLITRVRGRMDVGKLLRQTPVFTWPIWLLIEPGAFLMERRMLLEIKRLVEARSASAKPSVTRLAAASVARFLRLATTGALRLRRDRLGAAYAIERGGTYEIFRETVRRDGATAAPVVLVVGFRLKLIRAITPLHWLFQRACILTTPFWSGGRGFRVKLWLVDPVTKNYLGIYEWDGAANARTYAEALTRVLCLLSTPGSVWYELHPASELEPFLRARQVDRRPAGEPAAGPAERGRRLIAGTALVAGADRTQRWPVPALPRRLHR
jgi:hypothetical protein